VFTWTGFYLGGSVGYGWASYNHTFVTAGHYNLAAGNTFNYNGGGFVGGLQAGFNYQINQFVLGLEASATFGSLGSGTKISPFFPATDTWRSNVSWIGAITPRLGIAFDRAHVYVKGGLAFTSVRDRVQDLVDFVDVSNGRTGYNLGVGLEYAFTNNWILGAEYNYYNFGSQNINQNSCPLAGGACFAFGTNHNLRTNVSTATVGLKYKF
jgi:outer membrane immunogenic protein